MIWFSHLMSDADAQILMDETGMGLESIEFSIAENLDHLEDSLLSYKKRVQDMNCSSQTLHGPFLDLNPVAFDRLVQDATMYRYQQAYEAAERLGAGKIVFHSCFVPSVYMLEGWSERAADFFERFLDGKSEKIQILMENVLDPYPEPLAAVAEKISHPAFGLCLDLGHANCYSEIPCTQWAEVLDPYVRHLHIHDNRGKRDEHLAPGQGTVPYEKLREFVVRKEATIECRRPEEVRDAFHWITGMQRK